jgi:hypothetical protein
LVALSLIAALVANTDQAGIHVRLLSTGEERLIPTPSVVQAGPVPEVDAWFPNGTELLAHSRGSRVVHHPDFTRVRTGRSESDAFSIGRNSPVLRVAMQLARRLRHDRNRPHVDGQRLAYVRASSSRQWMETCDLRGQNRTEVVVAEVRGISWLPDKRIIYSQGKRMTSMRIFGKSAWTLERADRLESRSGSHAGLEPIFLG